MYIFTYIYTYTYTHIHIIIYDHMCIYIFPHTSKYMLISSGNHRVVFCPRSPEPPLGTISCFNPPGRRLGDLSGHPCGFHLDFIGFLVRMLLDFIRILLDLMWSSRGFDVIWCDFIQFCQQEWGWYMMIAFGNDWQFATARNIAISFEDWATA